VDLALQIFHYVVWFPLAVLVISAILRCRVRQYPLIFAFMTATFLIAVAEMPSAFAVAGSHWTLADSDLHRKLYAIAQGVTHLLIFAVVASFILRATKNLPIGHLVRLGLAIGGPVFIAVSFFAHYDGGKVTVWMTPWTRDVNFGAAIVDLILWGLLLSSRKKDHTLLLLVGGIGISFAGDAISDAIRSIALQMHVKLIWDSASVFSGFTDAAWLFVWWQAFRKEAADRKLGQQKGKAAISG
jgi:hypothetical protein